MQEIVYFDQGAFARSHHSDSDIDIESEPSQVSDSELQNIHKLDKQSPTPKVSKNLRVFSDNPTP